ncbi:MAG: WG repeat-containing protein [Clostridia bacterium]|nr:WG repeat-containing protein [Clostridia bacterium]
MKKNFTRIVCLALALIMVALCCACGEHRGTPESGSEPDAAELEPLDTSMTDFAFVGYGVASFKDAATGKLGLINSSGEIIVPAEYASVKYCAMELYCILTKSDGSEYTYDPEREEMYDGNHCAHGGPAEFFWDSDNNKVVYYEIEAVDVPEEDLPAEGEAEIIYDLKTRKVGLVGHDGKLVLEPTYDKGLHFTNGLAALQKDGRWGYVNASGEEGIGFYYDAAYTSVACVSRGEELPYNADDLGCVALNHDTLYGVMNGAGEVACPFQYKDIISFGDGKFACYRIDGKWVLGNISGIAKAY